jgi:hypothetical protein
MRRTYDVIGSGEGISGLLACALLASKGLKCLFIDTSPQKQGTMLWPDMPMLVTQSFFQGIMKPVLLSLEPLATRSLNSQHVQLKQWSDTEELLPIDPVKSSLSLNHEAGLCMEYLSFLLKSMTKPQRLWRELTRRAPEASAWHTAVMSGLSMTGAGRVSYLHSLASILGVCTVDHGRIKDILGSHIARENGDYLKDSNVEFITAEEETLGLNVNGTVYKAHHYLTEDIPDSTPYDGFFLYGRCEAKGKDVAPRLGDQIIVILPPEDLDFPIVLRVLQGTPRTKIMIFTRIWCDNSLISLMEIFSWASGMVFKHLTRVVSSMGGSILGFEAVNPVSNDTIRPYFRFSEVVHAPSLFTRRHYITPQERMYACDRDKYSCLGADGEFFWGVCIANAVLRDLRRSDLITVKPG